MKKAPDTPISIHNGHPGTGSSLVSRFDSPEIQAQIAAADIVVGIDPEQELRAVFHGRERMEECIRLGIACEAIVLNVRLDFVSDEPERLHKLIRELKGNSSFRPADLFPKIEIDAPSFSTSPDLLAPVRLAVDELRTQHRTFLPLMQRRFYYYVRARGFTAAHEALRDGMELARKLGATEIPQAYIVCLATLGEFLYGRLRPELVQRTRCVDVLHCEGADDHKLMVRCRSLRSREIPGGRAYFSRRMPRLRFGMDKRDGLIAFSKHALARVYQVSATNY